MSLATQLIDGSVVTSVPLTNDEIAALIKNWIVITSSLKRDCPEYVEPKEGFNRLKKALARDTIDVNIDPLGVTLVSPHTILRFEATDHKTTNELHRLANGPRDAHTEERLVRPHEPTALRQAA